MPARLLLIAILTVVAGCRPPAALFDMHEDNINRIVEHKWWSKKPPRKWVDGVIADIVRTNAEHVLFFSKSGQTEINKITYRDGTTIVVSHPNWGEDHGSINITGAVRYTPEQAAEYWLAELNRLEFRDGPGR